MVPENAFNHVCQTGDMSFKSEGQAMLRTTPTRIRHSLALLMVTLILGQTFAETPQATLPTTISAKVQTVSDGDTFSIFLDAKTRERVRLSNVDAPEHDQAYGPEAKAFVENLILGKTVTLVTHGRDQYSRILAVVYLSDGRSLQSLLVASGFAWDYRQFSNDPELAELEEKAREKKVGLWASPNPTPPWIFRHNKGK